MLKWILLLILALVLTYDIARIYLLLQKTIALEDSITPYERIKADARFRILVLGDSTAYGTGARSNVDTTAGRLASQYPDAEVVNLAVNGLRIKGLEGILKGRDEGEHFDIVLIQIGANDIIRLTSMKDIEAGIKRVLERSEKFGGKVVFLHSGDIGEAKFFPWYVRPILSRRSLEVKKIYEKAAEIYPSSYVDIIDSAISIKMKENPKLYYSADLLHLSSEGYALWYEEIAKKL